MAGTCRADKCGESGGHVAYKCWACGWQVPGRWHAGGEHVASGKAGDRSRWVGWSGTGRRGGGGRKGWEGARVRVVEGNPWKSQ